MISKEIPGYITDKIFIKKASEVEKTMESLGIYFDLSDRFFWSISEEGIFSYGAGLKSLSDAFTDGKLGVICLATSGEFRGSRNRRSYLLLITGYCKHRSDKGTFIQNVSIDLYLGYIPIASDWINSLFKPFITKKGLPFDALALDPVYPRYMVWYPQKNNYKNPSIKGIMGKYKYFKSYDSIIDGIIANTNWCNQQNYNFVDEWNSNNESYENDDWKEIGFDNKKRSQVPLELIDECVINLTNPVPLFEDIISKKVTTFSLPIVKHLELDCTGFSVHILGINGGPVGI